MHFWREKYFRPSRTLPLRRAPFQGGRTTLHSVRSMSAACGARRSTFLKGSHRPWGATSVANQMKEMAQRSELYVLRRAHGIYFNLVPLLRLRSMEALYLAGEGNSRIDVNVM